MDLSRYKLYEILHWLSLDVVLGACAGMCFFAHLLEVRLEATVYLLLALAVWCIYTLDHLLDVYGLRAMAQTPRHRFHQKHFKALLFALASTGLIGAIWAYRYLEKTEITYAAIGLGCLILLNILLFKWLARRYSYLKELLTAVFYVSGIALAPALIHSIRELPEAFWIIYLAYVALAWINLLFMALLDRSSDLKDDMPSFSTALGELSTWRFLSFLFILTFIYLLVAFWLLPSYHHIYLSVLMLILLCHAVFFFNPKPVLQKSRIILECSFLFGFLLVFF